ncbi:non-ribosomal peptide synthetase [Amycolatopsis taiwanensis]|uniref:non-ribosomal peptide synthetase n=1 Tax=Amycolatopsis taiwanensis TaxID=342230 RepID=UPI00048478EC|nr:non-ribosomal peptide synthetase [Amycolatopsis taiwanensis]
MTKPALVPREARVAPLSFAQERLWFIDAASPGSATYNVPLFLRWTEPVDTEALAAALTAVVRRHEVLRTTYRLEDGAPVQVVNEPGLVPVTEVWLDDAGDTGERVRADAVRRGRLPFDLSTEPALRCVVWRGVPGGDAMLLCVHHIAMDGWSSGPLLSDLDRAYRAALAGREPGFAELPLQYSDFAVRDRESFDSPEMATRLATRVGELLVTPPELVLFGRRGPTRIEGERRGDRYVFEVPDELLRRIGALATALRATPFVVLLAAFQVVMQRWSEREDFSLGTIMANRSASSVDELVGFFVNTVPLRCSVNPLGSFRELCTGVRAEAFSALTHQRIPFDRLTAAARERGAGALANVTFALQNMPEPDYPDTPRWTMPEVLPTATAKSDLLMLFEQGSAGLRGVVEYDVDRYSAEIARQIGDGVATVLAAAVAEPDLPVAALPLTRRTGGAPPNNVLVGPRKPHAATTILDVLAERIAQAEPGACAVSCGADRTSWAELDGWSWAIAARARELDATFIPVLAARGGAFLAGWIGVLRAGAAYVPLSLDTPPHRMEYILDEVGATTVLADGVGAEILAGFGGRYEVLRIDELRDVRVPAEPVPVDADAPVTVLYTSGTTGRPKGAVLKHRGLLNTVLWWAGEVDLTPSDRVLCSWTTQFDAASFDIFRTLAAGAELVLADDVARRDPRALLRLLRGPGAPNVTSTTPALLRAMLDVDPSQDPTGVRAISVGGEALTQRLVVECKRRWGAPVHNIYGPTEISCLSTGAWIDPEEERPPIGPPIPNMRAYVLGRHGEELPSGAPGELYLAGDGVGLGYLADSEHTDRVFVPDILPDRPGDKMYRTGDRVRIREDGQLDFLGRFDGYVKIMGNRIDPNDVRTLLEEQPSVRAAVVHPRGTPTRLIAHVVLSDVDRMPTREELLKPLLGWLPPPVLPAEVYVVESVPRNAHDKVDIRALLELPAIPLPHADDDAGAPGLDEDTRRAADLVAGVLSGVAPEDLRADSNFFAVGGHSLLAVRLIAEAERRWGVSLRLREFLADPTLAGLGRLLAGAPSIPDTRVEELGRCPATSVQQRLWFLDRTRALRTSYLVPTVIEFTGGVDAERLRLATAQVLARHPALRSRFELDHEQRRVFYRTDGPPPPVGLLDATAKGLSADELASYLDERCWTPFDLDAELPTRAEIIADSGRVLLVLVSHHLVFDGWSRDVVFRELTVAYSSTVDDLPDAVHPAELVGTNETDAGEMIERLRGAPTDVELPGRRARPAVQAYTGAAHVITLGAGLTARLRAVTAELGCSAFVTAATLVAAALARRVTQRDFLFAFPWSGRDRAGSAHAVGMFVNTLVLRTDLRDNPTWRDALVRVREEAKACYRNADVPFEKLAEALHPDRDLSRPPLTPVYLGDFAGRATAPDLGEGITSRLLPLTRFPVKYELELTVTDLDDDLELAATYAAGLLDAATVADLLGGVVAAAEDLAANPDTAVL